MKPTAFVVNTARGMVVDEAAIARALAENRIAGAALDTFEVEPLPPSSPLRQLGDKVLLSPHATSGVLEDTTADGARLPIQAATNAVLAVLDGTVPEYVYNKEAIPAWRARFGGKAIPR
jgi:phosphoglycerate dehydrogenase-like enzyme